MYCSKLLANPKNKQFSKNNVDNDPNLKPLCGLVNVDLNFAQIKHVSTLYIPQKWTKIQFQILYCILKIGKITFLSYLNACFCVNSNICLSKTHSSDLLLEISQLFLNTHVNFNKKS